MSPPSTNRATKYLPSNNWPDHSNVCDMHSHGAHCRESDGGNYPNSNTDSVNTEAVKAN